VAERVPTSLRGALADLVKWLESTQISAMVIGGVALLSAGESPETVLKGLLDSDDHFEDSTIAARQVGLVDVKGRSAVYTGSEALRAAWAGAEHGDGYSVQGNGLAGKRVVDAMKRTFLSSSGTLTERLMSSLEAGQAAGGQTIGKLSAALLVRTTEGGWQDIDLRVDDAAEPIDDLRRLMEQHYALQAIIWAEHQARNGMTREARSSISDALRRSRGWDRIWCRAARLATTMGGQGKRPGLSRCVLFDQSRVGSNGDSGWNLCSAP
jgi:uncharacterized Ntn-hydrolase superfamily protein